MILTSLAKCSKCYRSNKKTIILVVTVLEVEIEPKATTLGRRKTFVAKKFDLGGGEMKVATINIRNVKIHTPEPLSTAINGDD